jgi:hypothetical protein
MIEGAPKYAEHYSQWCKRKLEWESKINKFRKNVLWSNEEIAER